ncbi:MAG: hypothetical protein EPO24_08735 [Bacteroidetes bacterium]|nr:MAG: hypothetical protein EPO24_08735 [Bacteroidota bacterium]
MKTQYFNPRISKSISLTGLLVILVCASIVSGCGSSSSGWKKAEAINTIEAYQEFLDSNPSEELAAAALGKIDTLSYLRAKEEHTISAYERYVRQFPKGAFFDEVSQRLEKLFYYQRTEAENSLNGYDDFLSRFPNGVFAGEARRRREQLYFNQQISNAHTITAYQLYLQQYPDGTYADSAKIRIERLTYENANSVDSIKEYLDYLKRYPEGTFKADALARIDLCTFREANKEGTIDAFENYLRQYPQGIYTAAAQHRIATLVEAFQQARVVRVAVEQLYYQSNRLGMKDDLTGVSLPIESLTRRLLSEHANITAVGPDAKSYGATLNIHTEGIALGKDYRTDSLHYTGASFSGTLAFDMLGYPSFKREFSVTMEPPVSSTPIRNSTSGLSAPFPKVFRDQESFLAKLVELLYKIYGTRALVSVMRDADEQVRANALDVAGALKVDGAFTSAVNALRDNNFPVRQRASLALGLYRDDRAVEPLVRNLEEILDFDWIKEESESCREKAAVALGMIGSTRAIKPLIGALREPSMKVRREAAVALKKITTKDFGEDYDAWLKWWEGQTKQ